MDPERGIVLERTSAAGFGLQVYTAMLERSSLAPLRHDTITTKGIVSN
jgi:hypothetical protein